MAMLPPAFRNELIAMLRQSDEPELLAFADELQAAGAYAEATEDEIERFMNLI